MLTLERLQEIYAAARDRMQCDYEAACEQARAEADAQIDEQLASILKPEVAALLAIRREYDTVPLDRWDPCSPVMKRVELLATPVGLPDGVTIELALALHDPRPGYRGARAALHPDSVFVSIPRVGSPVYQLHRDDTGARQAEVLSSLLVPEIQRQTAERDRRRREREKNEASWRRFEEQNEARERHAIAFAARIVEAEERLRGLVETAEAQLAEERAADLAERGWPDGHTLTLYLLDWLAGVDADGDPLHETHYTVESFADHDGFWPVLGVNGERRLRIESPNGYRIEELAIHGPSQLPELWMRERRRYRTTLAEPVRCEPGCCEQAAQVAVEIAPADLLHPAIAALPRS